MAIQRFWDDFVSKAGLINPPGVNSEEQVYRRQRYADEWLEPKTVAGFDPADFGFLVPTELGQLTAAVRAFLKVSGGWHRDTPEFEQLDDGSADPRPTSKQADDGAAYYREALSVLRPDRYSDPEALRIGKLVEREVASRLPEWVAELRFETGPDSTGDPAMWVWVILRDDAGVGQPARQDVTPVRSLMFQAAREVAPDRWTYVRFRTVSEQAGVIAAGGR